MALKYWKKAAEGGHVMARHNLGCIEYADGDFAAAIRHWRMSASGGSKRSMNNIILRFEDGLLHHKDLALTLRAFYCSSAELKSDGRTKFIEFLKTNGEYQDDLVDF